MRLIYSILCITAIAALFAWNAQASDLSGGFAADLKTSKLDAASAEFLATFCEKKAGMFTIPTKKVCDAILSDAKMTQATFDYCLDQSKDKGSQQLQYFSTCAKFVKGREYPYSYITACHNVTEKMNTGVQVSSVKICLDYLSNTSSSFNSDAYEFCLNANDNNFQKAKPCINSVRDREVDTQKLARECLKNGEPTKDTNDCVDKLADSMPSLIACGKTNRIPASAEPKKKAVR
jgi:hypothetical protein